MQKFWWGHKNNDKKIHWMSCRKMGRAKSQGGMGFRDLHCFNNALLAKQCWRLVQQPESLVAKIIKAKYYPKNTLLASKLGSRPSLVWRSILSAKNLLQAGIVWRIVDGQSVHIWGDKWIPKMSSFSIQTPCRILPMEAKVCNMIESNHSRWNISLIRENFW